MSEGTVREEPDLLGCHPNRAGSSVSGGGSTPVDPLAAGSTREEPTPLGRPTRGTDGSVLGGGGVITAREELHL